LKKLPQIRTVISDFSGLEEIGQTSVSGSSQSAANTCSQANGASAIFSLSGYNVAPLT
jgi:hypothetical protein